MSRCDSGLDGIMPIPALGAPRSRALDKEPYLSADMEVLVPMSQASHGLEAVLAELPEDFEPGCGGELIWSLRGEFAAAVQPGNKQFHAPRRQGEPGTTGYYCNPLVIRFLAYF